MLVCKRDSEVVWLGLGREKQCVGGRLAKARVLRPVGYNVCQHPTQHYLRCPSIQNPSVQGYPMPSITCAQPVFPGVLWQRSGPPKEHVCSPKVLAVSVIFWVGTDGGAYSTGMSRR